MREVFIVLSSKRPLGDTDEELSMLSQPGQAY